jgi:hypothetical protein
MSGRDDQPQLSLFCDELRSHRKCPHLVGASTSLLGGKRRPKRTAFLCLCDCHACPLGGRAEAPFPEWQSACTCPGANPLRSPSAQRAETSDDPHKELHEEIDRENSKTWRNAFTAYAAYGAVSVALGVTAWRTSGVVRIVLAVLAGVGALVTAWSVLFMGGWYLLIRAAQRRDRK